MDSYQRILVVVDEHDFTLKGISRAAYIAGKNHAAVIVMLLEHGNTVNRLLDAFEVKTEIGKPSTLEEKYYCLHEFTKKAAHTGINISMASISCHSSDDVMQFCLDFKVDAVVVSASRHKMWDWLTIKPLDLRLVRESDQPVFVVKDHPWQPGGHILSFVEPCCEDEDHKSLNSTVLQTSAHFSHLLQGDCHLIDCFYGDNPSISFHLENDQRTNQQHHIEKLSNCLSQYHLDSRGGNDNNSLLHVAKALPEDAIESVAKEVDSELVIVGDFGHQGLLNNMCGNIAELVIDRINCDLLVVKPQSMH
ncbi:universal stress protein [Shewanella colwelliana]|uniref:universal stress protein n=1 Tax=Shewanella colwelliana TaxID=23 RepID=UPI0037352646